MRRQLRHRILQRGLCEAPDNADLQEALQQSLSEMARTDAAARCRSLWKRPDEELKPSYLFSRQFLGIGTASGDSESQALAAQARSWEQQSEQKSLGPLWPDNILEPLEGRKLRVGYLSADLANHPWVDSCFCAQSSQPGARGAMGLELRIP